jgi:hypothetical protein
VDGCQLSGGFDPATVADSSGPHLSDKENAKIAAKDANGNGWLCMKVLGTPADGSGIRGYIVVDDKIPGDELTIITEEIAAS